jgi:adenylate kinase
MLRFVLMGPPGVGKGTQAVHLKEHAGVAHVSTGDLLRAAMQDGTELGRKAKGFVESGGLVPDSLMGELLARRLSEPDSARGFILDGFPRTAAQVEILDGILNRLGVALDRVFILTAPEGEIVRRLSGRRMCSSCGALYHVESKPPRSAGACDACGAPVIQRADDNEEVIRKRLRVYLEQTLPVADAYRKRGLLMEVDGTGGPGDVWRRLEAVIPRS